MLKMKKTCIDVINYLISSIVEIDSFEFIEFNGYNLIQKRIDTENLLNKPFEEALDIRAKYNFPFWDCFNVSLFDKCFEDYSFLDEILFHNRISWSYNIKKGSFNDFIIQTKKYLTISSEVTVSNQKKCHLLLLDFHIPVNIENQKICIEILKRLNVSGFLLDSGKSYHFYSNKLFSQDKLLEILSYALLFSPIIDRAWIAHQLIQKKCCLRVSEKYDRLPIVVYEIL